MRKFISVILLAGHLCFSGVILGEQKDDFQRIIDSHDVTTAAAMAKYYLKGVTLLSIRGLLEAEGEKLELGSDWSENNIYWKRGEAILLEEIYEPVALEYDTMQWIHAPWREMLDKEYTPEDINKLSKHLQTDVGKKQAQIIDHYLSLYVMRTLTFSGKLHDVAGTGAEKNQMQTLYVKQDEEVFFSIKGSDNAEGQAFALSLLGKKYFADNVIKLVGIFNEQMNNLAADMPKRVIQNKYFVHEQIDNFTRRSD